MTPSPTPERLTPARLLAIIQECIDTLIGLGVSRKLAESPKQWVELRAHAAYLETQQADADKVKAFNLLLTAVSPTVRLVAARYLEGVKDFDAFVEYLRNEKRVELQDADIDEDCR